MPTQNQTRAEPAGPSRLRPPTSAHSARSETASCWRGRAGPWSPLLCGVLSSRLPACAAAGLPQALSLRFADALQLTEVGLELAVMDFLRSLPLVLVCLAVSLAAVRKFSDGAFSEVGAPGFFATFLLARAFYVILNDGARFLRRGDTAGESQKGRRRKSADSGL